MKLLLTTLLLPVLVYAQAGSAARQLFADFFEDYLRLNPEAATAFGRADYDNRWTDWSAGGSS